MSFKDMTPTDLHDHAPPNVAVIDVREPEEWADGHLENAVNIPMGELQDALHSHPVFEDTERPLVMFCRSGNRSGSAAQFLTECGYCNVYNLAGGIIAWSEAGYPLTGDG